MSTNGGKLSVMAGLIVLGLSPSFIDWQQSPDKRHQILGYYGVAIALIALGLWDGQ
jgi:hypothetical protein